MKPACKDAFTPPSCALIQGAGRRKIQLYYRYVDLLAERPGPGKIKPDIPHLLHPATIFPLEHGFYLYTRGPMGIVKADDTPHVALMLSLGLMADMCALH